MTSVVACNNKKRHVLGSTCFVARIHTHMYEKSDDPSSEETRSFLRTRVLSKLLAVIMSTLYTIFHNMRNFVRKEPSVSSERNDRQLGRIV